MKAQLTLYSNTILILFVFFFNFLSDRYQVNLLDIHDESVTLTHEDSGTEIFLNPGMQLELILPANPSTGYIWDLSGLDQNMFRLVERHFEPESELTGSPGLERILLQAQRPSQSNLRLVYRRTWEVTPADASIFEAQVTIEGEPLSPNNSSESILPDVTSQNFSSEMFTTDLDLPASFDWRSQNGTTPIKDQNGCGSCWAFATVGVLEAAQKIHTGQDIDLSEQFLIGHNESNWSCSGGGPAFDHHNFRIASLEREAGVILESDCPYRSTNSKCPGSQPFRHPYTIDASMQIQASTEAIKQAIFQYGPVYTTICTGPSFSAYRTGVFETNESNYCSGGTNHAVVLVGWDDNQGSQGVWFLRNSWGASWGESGYMRIGYGVSNTGRYNFTAVYDGAPLHTDIQYGGLFKAIALEYPYAYVGIGNRLGVLDISNLAQSQLVGMSIPLPGTINRVTVNDGYAYVTSYWRGLSVFDLTDPENPQFVYSDFYLSGSSGEDLVISGTTGYYVDNFHLNILSLANPARPTRIGSMVTSGRPVTLEVSGNYAYIASWSVGLNIINVSNPAGPFSVALFDTPGFAVDIELQGQYAYIADQLGGLRIIDIINPAVPFEAGFYDTPGSAEGVDIVGTLAYVADGSNGLLVLDISNPVAPSLVAELDTPGTAYSPIAAGSSLFLTDGETGMRVIDINQMPPVEIGSYTQVGKVLDMQTSPEMMYAATGQQGLVVLDISQLPEIIEKSRLPALNTLQKLYLSDEYLYGLDGDILRTFNLEDPSRPQTIAALPVGSSPDLAVVGDYAYLASENSGIKIVDLQQPENPQVLGSISLTPSGGRAFRIIARGSNLYVLVEPVSVGNVLTGGGLFVLDISQPAAPVQILYWPATTSPTDFALINDYAIVAEKTSWWEGDFSLGGVHVLDLRYPPIAVEVSRILISEATLLNAEGSMVYIKDDGRGIFAFDLQNPDEPRLQASLRYLSGAVDLHISSNILWIASEFDGIYAAWRLQDRMTAYIPTGGGQLVGKSNQAEFIFPEGYFSDESAVTFHQYSKDPQVAGMGGAGMSFLLYAVSHTDSQPVTAQGVYSSILNYLPRFTPEPSLKLFHLDDDSWLREATSQLDMEKHQLTAHPDQTGIFAILGLIPPSGVSLLGSLSATTNSPVSFTAEAQPDNLVGPLIFRWTADEQNSIQVTQETRFAEMSFSWSTPGQKQVTVEVENEGGSTQSSIWLEVRLPPPEMPNGFTASDGHSSEHISLNWRAVNEADSYQLFRSLDTFLPIDTLVSLAGTSYIDSSAAPGRLYYYWIKACNSSGCSNYSPVETGFRALNAPEHLIIGDPTQLRQISLRWDEVNGAHWYQIFRSVENTLPPNSPLTDQLASLSYLDLAVEAGQSYTYWVKACCDTGCSQLSTPAFGYLLIEKSVFLPFVGR